MSTTPFWKKINQTVTGHSQNVTEEIVSEILKLSKNELMQGFLNYKPYTKNSFDDWVAGEDVSNDMKDFVNELSQNLNLDVTIAYPVMCNYLMFEYYGKIKEFWQITRIGTTVHLKEIIWNYYTAERMFLLKTLRQIFEFVDTDYEFAQQYENFLASISIEELQNNLIKQFETLIKDSQAIKGLEKNFEKELCRNCRERIEILIILIFTLNHHNFNETQLRELMRVYINNNFSIQSSYYENASSSNKQDLNDLMCAEVCFYLTVLGNSWDQDLTQFWKDSSTMDLDDSILSLHLDRINSVIKLAWLLLKFKSTQYNIDGERISSLFTTRPLVGLSSIISNEIFQNGAGKIVLKATHKILDYFCLMYSDRKKLYEEKSLTLIVAEFLKDPDLAQICSQTRDGLDNLIQIAIAAFPFDFFSFTKIAQSLLGQKAQFEQAIDLLRNLPTYLVDSPEALPNEAGVLRFPQNIKVETYKILDRNLLLFHSKYSYFHYLEYLVVILVKSGSVERKFDEGMIREIEAGYNVVIQGIENCGDMDLKAIGIQRVVKKLNSVIINFDGPLLNYDLAKLYFRVYNTLLCHNQQKFFEICPEKVWAIFLPKIAPEYRDVDIRVYLLDQSIFENTVFIKLFRREEQKDDHTLMLTYIQLLHKLFKIKSPFQQFLLPGLIYVLSAVFLQHQMWIYKDENQRTQITLESLNIFHYILQQKCEDLDSNDKKIFEVCRNAFLNNSYIIDVFSRLFIKDKYHLIVLMEREANWTTGPALQKLHCIHMQLAVLLLVMKHRKLVEGCTLFGDKLSFIVKPVASYFTNSYSSVIAELSCRFLEKLAQDAAVPLLALLELDHYQVQSLFLERLRDPLEEENVKLAIIDLINACIAKQNGMTAAFFNLKCFMYWDGTEDDILSGDSVSDFMVDYLQNIKKSHDYFKNPLQLGILRLLHNLWRNHRENLIENIAKLKDFWPVMTDPFFCEFVQDEEVYTYILKIINSEIGTNNPKVDEKLVQVVEKFLKDKQQLQLCIEYVINASQNTKKDNLELISAWAEFLILAKKILPDCFDDDVKSVVIIACLDGLKCPLADLRNLEIAYTWTQLYLLLTTAWPVYTDRETVTVQKITNFLHHFNVYYKYLKPKFKEIILCIIEKTIEDFQQIFKDNMSSFNTFLNIVGAIIDIEHDFLISEVWSCQDDLQRVTLLKPWLIIISIVNSLLAYENVDEISTWFNYRQILERVMNTVCSLVTNKSTIPFAQLAIDHLITYAESPLRKDFLFVNLMSFYSKIEPPNLTIRVEQAVGSGLPGLLKEWWMTFIPLMKLNRILTCRLQGAIVKTSFKYVKHYRYFLKDILALAACTVDLTALSLVCETLKFINALQQSLPYWHVQHTESYTLILNQITISMNACILSILGYKKIRFYNIVDKMMLTSLDDAPTELLISILNKLIEIIYWSCICLAKTKPDLVTLLNYETEKIESLHLWVEDDFRVPQFELSNTPTLTYGMILCLGHYLCKALNQLPPEVQGSTPRSRQVSTVRDKVRVKNLGAIFEHCNAAYEKCIGFMVYLQGNDDLPNEKLSTFLHYNMSEFSGSAGSIVTQLDYFMVKNSLESLMIFLLGEVFFAMKTLHGENLFAYKRELSSEMQFFYEFVRRRTAELYNVTASTPNSLSVVLPQNENDIIRRYTIAKKNDVNDIADQNFLIAISHWMTKLCHLSKI